MRKQKKISTSRISSTLHACFHFLSADSRTLALGVNPKPPLSGWSIISPLFSTKLAEEIAYPNRSRRTFAYDALKRRLDINQTDASLDEIYYVLKQFFLINLAG